jgi:hypothetical protein
MSSPGAHVVSTFKSGGNELSSLTNFDFESGGMVTDNIDEELESRAGTPAPVRSFKEFHTDLGGPIVKDKFWFWALQLFKIDKTISSVSPDLATDVGIFNEFTSKINWQVSERTSSSASATGAGKKTLPRSPDDPRRVHPGPG